MFYCIIIIYFIYIYNAVFEFFILSLYVNMPYFKKIKKNFFHFISSVLSVRYKHNRINLRFEEKKNAIYFADN